MSSCKDFTNMKTVRFQIAAFSLSLLVVGCCGAPPVPVTTSVPEAVQEDEPAGFDVGAPIIPRRILYGNPDKAAARLSPDGSRLSFLAPLEGVLNVWVGPASDPSQAKPVTEDKKRGIRIYFWAYTQKHIIYLQDKDGDENWHVYMVDLEKGETKDLTPQEGIRAQIESVSHKRPEEILVGLNDRDPQLHDVYLVNLLTGEKTLAQENPGFAEFIIDDDYNIRFGVKMTKEGGLELLSPPKKPVKGKGKNKGLAKKKAGESKGSVPQQEWETFMTVSPEDTLTTSPIDFDKTGRILYLLDSRDRDTAAFATLNLDTGEKTIISKDDRADLADLMIHPTEKTVEAVAFTYERKQWKTLDTDIAKDFDVLSQVEKGDFEVVSRTLDDKNWIVAYVVDNGPARYFHYDRSTQKANFLFTNRTELENQPLVEMLPRVITSRDNLNLVSYLSLPPGSDPDGDGRPDSPLPMVLNVHGGPWARVSWGYNPTHQWFANRGYAVLSVNFRGSTGFGKGFINASSLEWAGKMHDDLVDAIEWAVEQGIAKQEKVAIFGGSYGGYATLVGLTFTPKTFACGVDIVGPSNLVTLLNSIPPYWAPMINLFTTRVGDHRTDEGKAFLTERSPLTHVDRIERPLLIGQGANDPRVKQNESDQIVKAMQEKQIPVTYVLYPDEGHGFARPENRISFFAVTEAFLSECLGGRFEPIGNDIKGSSIDTPTGAEFVPGLREALEGRSAPTAEEQKR